MNDKFLELALKLKALAEKGEGGEAENAERFLRKLMKEHHITDEMLERELVDVRTFKVKKEQRQFFAQVACSCMGRVDIFSGRGIANKLYIKCTVAEHLEIEAKFNFYWSRYQDDLSIFYSAFIQANHLYTLGSEVNEKDVTAEEKQKLMKILEMAEGLDKHTYRKQIATSS